MRRLSAKKFSYVMLFGLLSVPDAIAFPTQDDTSPGSLALQYKRRANVWSRFDLGIVDAKIISHPPDSTRFDRRAEALTILGFDAPIGTRFGVRLNAKGEESKRRQQEESPPKADLDETIQTGAAELDVTFVTDKGLELFGGVQILHHFPHSQTLTTDTTSSRTDFAKALVESRRFGVIRRGGAWSGGFYYELGGETKRSFSQSASDGSLASGSEIVFLPPRVGVVGEFGISPMFFDFELTFIQARGVGPRDDLGNALYTDHFQARAAGTLPLAIGGVELGVAHRTLSYSHSAFISFDTMPVTSLRALLILGNVSGGHAYAGVIYGFGRDGQSLPEFNTTYELQAGAASAGLFLPM